MSTKQTDKEAILALYKDWITAVEEGSREGYVALLDQDVRMTPPGAEDIISKKVYAEFLIPVLSSASYGVTPLGGYEIDVMGDLALVRYDYIVSVSLNEGVDGVDQAGALNQQESSLKYSDVLRRQPDGGWKVLRHTWNDNVASND
ncbi:MAG: nuclear transport factor 2 family protein [Halioglobus sp.]